MNFFNQWKLKFVLWGLKPMLEKIWSVLDGKKLYLAGIGKILAGIILWIDNRDINSLVTNFWEGWLIIAGKSALNKIKGA